LIKKAKEAARFRQEFKSNAQFNKSLAKKDGTSIRPYKSKNKSLLVRDKESVGKFAKLTMKRRIKDSKLRTDLKISGTVVGYKPLTKGKRRS
jgi:hypothetical protein